MHKQSKASHKRAKTTTPSKTPTIKKQPKKTIHKSKKMARNYRTASQQPSSETTTPTQSKNQSSPASMDITSNHHRAGSKKQEQNMRPTSQQQWGEYAPVSKPTQRWGEYAPIKPLPTVAKTSSMKDGKNKAPKRRISILVNRSKVVKNGQIGTNQRLTQGIGLKKFTFGSSEYNSIGNDSFSTPNNTSRAHFSTKMIQTRPTYNEENGDDTIETFTPRSAVTLTPSSSRGSWTALGSPYSRSRRGYHTSQGTMETLHEYATPLSMSSTTTPLSINILNNNTIQSLDMDESADLHAFDVINKAFSTTPTFSQHSNIFTPLSSGSSTPSSVTHRQIVHFTNSPRGGGTFQKQQQNSSPQQRHILRPSSLSNNGHHHLSTHGSLISHHNFLSQKQSTPVAVVQFGRGMSTKVNSTMDSTTGSTPSSTTTTPSKISNPSTPPTPSNTTSSTPGNPKLVDNIQFEDHSRYLNEARLKEELQAHPVSSAQFDSLGSLADNHEGRNLRPSSTSRHKSSLDARRQLDQEFLDKSPVCTGDLCVSPIPEGKTVD